MATAFRGSAAGSIETSVSKGSWTGITKASHRGSIQGPVIKRSIATKRFYESARDFESWTRMRLREHPSHTAGHIDPNHDAIEAQVHELRQHAAEENEAFSESSSQAALRFCHELAGDREPAIFLMASGNLRAVWQNEARDQIAIQFMPQGILQYVILRDRDGMTLKALGEDVSCEKIKQTVEIHELSGLWFCGEG